MTDAVVTKTEVKVTTFSNEEALLRKVNPDLWLIYRALKVIKQWGGNGSIEVHFVRGQIRPTNGLYLKPGIDYQKLLEDTP